MEDIAVNIHTGSLVNQLLAALQVTVPAEIAKRNVNLEFERHLPDIEQWVVGYRDILTDLQEGAPVVALRSDEHYVNPDTSHMERFACSLVIADKESDPGTGWEHLCDYEAIVDGFLRTLPRLSDEIVGVREVKFQKGQSDGAYLCFVDFCVDVDIPVSMEGV